MIITRTPFRISFAGGGTDTREFYREEPGAVVSATIDKYIYLSIHPMFNSHKFHLKYFENELVEGVENIKHPIIKEVFRRFGVTGVDFNSSSDVPSGTGLGSSSSFTVGLINLCMPLSKLNMAKLACNIEIDKLKAPIGKQDQYAAACGGLNYMRFNPDESVDITPVQMGGIEDNLMLFYIGGPRKAENILTEQQRNTEKNRPILKKMVKLAESLRDNIDDLGLILHAGWMYKRELGGITTKEIDCHYALALKHGAIGGKLLGAGQGGFLLLYTKDKARLRAKMQLYELPFKFEQSGTQIIYNG